MRTRLKDVADNLKLSPALVSGVLNRRPNVWASEETRKRIIEAARTLNYQPSAAAQALSRGKSDTVALVYRRLEGPSYRLAYSGLVDTLSSGLQASGLGLAVANFADQEAVLDHLQKLAGTRACDAVILWGREQDTEAQGELLEKLGIPFLVKGRHERDHPNWNQIDFDHEGMMAQAVDHLADLGHSRLAYLGFPHDEAFVRALRRGYVQGHRRRLGSDPDPRFFAEHEDLVAPNAETINGWLSLPEDERPTGFVVGAGNSAWQALETCIAQVHRKLGFETGDDAAAGVTSLFFTLMFGNALVYQGIEIDSLARLALPELLTAIERGEPAESVHRFLPALSPAPSLDLLQHGVSFSGDAP
ncbi:LacI family DNA-binding transcriptional regulator [Fimbriimonas ginsengisoli]|uniref:ThuR, regulatory protein for trehalosemaltose transport system n=1 Tax=Fimbriimonas ginsengisoli Gsoil 348 TaxID=661478 RepID=A0A068NMX6_FIMGI|nr:LacI family DNA-binding transcriptional regulator [Fimbriimonas ginsengisoli]AIE84821.1 ThuR, regulatory protein for trehalosemaltose transport system [Fimbriimonas ginsengisoli Gsoil 348]